VFQHSKKKQRVKTIEFWIETARECFNVGNFNSLMAIIAGLNMSPISRLKKTVIQTIYITYIIGLCDYTSSKSVNYFCFVIFSGIKCNSPLSLPYWNSTWTRRPILAATDRHSKQLCGEVPVPPISVRGLSYRSFRCSSKTFTS